MNKQVKEVLSIHVGYEDLMLFYTDGTSEAMPLSEKCKKDEQAKTDSFAEAIRSSAAAYKQVEPVGDDDLDAILRSVRDAGAHDDNVGAEDWTHSDQQIEKAKAAIKAHYDAKITHAVKTLPGLNKATALAGWYGSQKEDK